MKAIVFGAGGMLGHALVRRLRQDKERGVEVLPVYHRTADVAEWSEVMDLLRSHQDADVVFNCAGVLNTSHDSIAMVSTNALGPHVLAAVTDSYGIPLVLISTDCVFSGRPPGNTFGPYARHEGYTTVHVPDPVDLYGRTKLAGEVEAPHVTVVRTSFVGPTHGLWAWVKEQIENGAMVDGWTKAKWSGSTVWAVADALVRMVDQDGGVAPAERSHGWAFRNPGPGIIHLATKKAISKYEAIDLIVTAIDKTLHIRETDGVQLDRTLWSTYELPSLEEALRQSTAFRMTS
ncbi:hypothetical protein LCGC14_0841480 [marine sediment metagenome]|uniref:RmlD-like substrate binding domain-containing protein n=1 Tax=marine sediment metagenome TaxID=412755 RepID=A0A0F9RXP6_9ZZZZ